MGYTTLKRLMRRAAFDLVLAPRAPGMAAHRWLSEALRKEILEGRLRPGARLPSSRDLAASYGLSRPTIVFVFEQLKSEGYIEGSAGSGTYVSQILPDDLLQVTSGSVEPSTNAPKNCRRWLSNYARRAHLFPNFENRRSRAFRANLPALNLFPTTVWAQLTTRLFRCAPASLLMVCEPLGYRPLREALADYLQTSRGVRCVPEQVAIVSGTQEALDLTARLTLNPGDRVCMEDPGYPGAALAFEAFGAKIRSIPVDNEGMKPTPAHLRGARLVYVTPGHQFPLGKTMSVARRLELLERAREVNALIFEDDYDSEYRYSGRPIPALQGLDRHGVVLFAGSFSKVMFPSLRLGYLVIPSDLVDRFEATISITCRHAPLLEQAVLCDFITEGHFLRHLRRMREVYAKRLSLLVESGQQKLSGLLEISNIEAGLQTVGWLKQGLKEERVFKAAAERNVEVIPLSWYTRGRPRREGLQLGFAAVDTQEIRRGVQDLAIALEAVEKFGFLNR
jgi:GntR family transcriptional regulator/MocR family aminotransferase